MAAQLMILVFPSRSMTAFLAQSAMVFSLKYVSICLIPGTMTFSRSKGDADGVDYQCYRGGF